MPFPASPYAQCGGLVYFPRMLSKMRLFAAGELPEAYHANRGNRADALLCEWLGVSYADLERAVLEGQLSDEDALDWVEQHRNAPISPGLKKVWNDFITKRGWNDDRTASLLVEVGEAGLIHQGIQTVFQLMVAEEGHPMP